MTRLERTAFLVCLLGFSWSLPALADLPRCPGGTGPWVDVIFSGGAWSPALQEAVLQELRIELSRRSLDACAHTSDSTRTVPAFGVTLLAIDADRVSIVPSRLQDEGGFSGRTIRIGSIPEDAKALAIAQAIDEALRGVPPASEPPPPRQVVVHESPPKPPPPVPVPAELRVGVALAGALQFAPAASTGANKTAIVPGAALRVSMTYAHFGASLGMVLTPPSDLSFSTASIKQTRIPVDASLRATWKMGPLKGAADAGVVVAFLREQYVAGQRMKKDAELGGRLGLAVSYDAQIAPVVGLSAELMPSSFDLRFVPTGSIGHTSNLWIGVSAGVQARWP